MKVLITGATGFIGQAVLIKLLEQRFDVTATYNSTPIESVINFLPNQECLNSVKLDLLNTSDLTACVAGHDCVIHLAYNFRGSVHEQMTFATRSTQSLLAACTKAKVRKLVYTSTISVYGEPPRSGLITEESPRIASLQPYASSKQAAERLFLEAVTEPTEVIILQPSIVYGPGKGSWSAGILYQMQNSLRPLVRHGNGYCNPVYVDDVAQAILQACEISGLNKECFIISNDEPITWKKFFTSYESVLAEKVLIKLPYYIYNNQSPIPRYRRGIRKAINKAAQMYYGKSIQYPGLDDIRFFSAQPIFSNQKASKLLNFRPQTSFENGMEIVRKWWNSDSRNR